MTNIGFILQGVTTVAGLGFIWYLVSKGQRRSIKTGRSPNEAER